MMMMLMMEEFKEKDFFENQSTRCQAIGFENI